MTERMPQKEAIAMIYALAKTALGMRSKEREALERIAAIVENEFMDSAKSTRSKK